MGQKAQATLPDSGDVSDNRRKDKVIGDLKTGTIEQGAAGINALQQEVRRLGLTMRSEDAKAAEDFTDAIDKLWR